MNRVLSAPQTTPLAKPPFLWVAIKDRQHKVIGMERFAYNGNRSQSRLNCVGFVRTQPPKQKWLTRKQYILNFSILLYLVCRFQTKESWDERTSNNKVARGQQRRNRHTMGKIILEMIFKPCQTVRSVSIYLNICWVRMLRPYPVKRPQQPAIYDTLLVHSRFNLVSLPFPSFNVVLKSKTHWTKSARSLPYPTMDRGKGEGCSNDLWHWL